MKNRRHTPEQVIRKLAEGDKLLAQGRTLEEVARHLEISEQTFYRWPNQYGGMKADDAKERNRAAQGEPAAEGDPGRPGARHRPVEGVG